VSVNKENDKRLLKLLPKLSIRRQLLKCRLKNNVNLKPQRNKDKRPFSLWKSKNSNIDNNL